MVTSSRVGRYTCTGTFRKVVARVSEPRCDSNGGQFGGEGGGDAGGRGASMASKGIEPRFVFDAAWVSWTGE